MNGKDKVMMFGLETCREGIPCLNPGSVSIPKAGSSRGYILLENGTFTWKTLDGVEYHKLMQN